ncbi:solute carrier family 3 (amino acid transporter heavy chain), member 2 L homeolog [Xenopus laevis]|uniref:MGC53951 protein n=1 Tax=Xenopus laevis TaxID=8355 RepID=Q7ZYQ1_XENLA|nr:solute carrier family 3 (amino acid transporter heavy chain), member 2 L homeolog [Xenopus laevis]AAH42294.1 MGC53951 protein [Xenopus laevis]
MTQDTALDMKDVELNELEQEKVPMADGAGDSPTGGGEKNGVVKVKLDDDDDMPAKSQKFTGLSKEELLRVAGTPTWVRVRWALLILFWLGWAGMLAGAVVIIVQAPRCRPLPAMEWWNKGPLYQVGDPATFQEDGAGNIQSIEKRLESLTSLKVKGLIIGPIHVTKKDQIGETELTDIDPNYGTMEQFTSLLEAARKKSIQIILDLTPNYRSENSWFEKAERENNIFFEKVKEAVNVWLEHGVGGIYFGDSENFPNANSFIYEWGNMTANYSKEGKPRVLLLSTSSAQNNLTGGFNETIDGTLFYRFLGAENKKSFGSLGESIKQYVEETGIQGNSWMIGAPQMRHMASLVNEKLLRVYQLLLFTLPGTPISLYGDEIGLKDLPGQPAQSSRPNMQWEEVSVSNNSPQIASDVNANITFKAQDADKGSFLNVYRKLSDLRGKERSLLHGEFTLLYNSEEAISFLRSWDQNERYVTALNFNYEGEVELFLKKDGGEELPEQGTVVLSSNPQRKDGETVSLKSFKLGAGEALLLKYPYSG